MQDGSNPEVPQASLANAGAVDIKSLHEKAGLPFEPGGKPSMVTEEVNQPPQITAPETPRIDAPMAQAQQIDTGALQTRLAAEQAAATPATPVTEPKKSGIFSKIGGLFGRK